MRYRRIRGVAWRFERRGRECWVGARWEGTAWGGNCWIGLLPCFPLHLTRVGLTPPRPRRRGPLRRG